MQGKYKRSGAGGRQRTGHAQQDRHHQTRGRDMQHDADGMEHGRIEARRRPAHLGQGPPERVRHRDVQPAVRLAPVRRELDGGGGIEVGIAVKRDVIVPVDEGVGKDRRIGDANRHRNQREVASQPQERTQARGG
jgi:hypothetical protein